MSIADLGRIPISGPSPAGGDARYDAVYLDLKAEIEKLDSITQAEQVDWERVTELASNILTSQSKDLMVAAYLAVSQAHLNGLPGIADGLQVLLDMVTRYWDDGFPPLKRLRGRLNALNWWREQTRRWLQESPPPSPVPQALYDDLGGNAKQLDQALAEKLPDFSPLRELIAQLEQIPLERPAEPQPRVTQTAAAGAAGGPDEVAQEGAGKNEQLGGESAGASSTSAASPQSEAPESIDGARQALVSAALDFAQLCRSASLADPWAWKVNRIAAWLPIGQLPPNQGGRTLLPAPEGEIKAALQAQFGSEHFAEAAKTAEEHFTGAIFWLDLQRFIDQALAGLGDDFAAARDAVQGELRALLTRLPGLETLSFAEGTAFADPQTLDWIETIQTAGATAGRSHRQSNPVAAALDKAEQLFANDDAGGALDCLTTAMRQATDGPSRLQLQQTQMMMLCRANHFETAIALANQLLQEIESRQLQAWQPDLAVELLMACYQSFMGRGEEADLTVAKDLLARVACLKPSAVLAL